jgi:hypothetical protein
VWKSLPWPTDVAGGIGLNDAGGVVDADSLGTGTYHDLCRHLPTGRSCQDPSPFQDPMEHACSLSSQDYPALLDFAAR